MRSERKNIRDYDGVLIKKLGPRKGFWPFGKSPFSVAVDTKKGVVHLSGNYRSFYGAQKAGIRSAKIFGI